MKKVWKCDFCSTTSENEEEMKEHEIKCSFNPKHKKCFSCGNYINYRNCGDDCKISLNILDGETDGNCKGWISEN
jgi:hypothetical protein